MMTPFGPHEPLVLPPATAVGAIGSNFARGRLRLLNDTTFAEIGVARPAGIGFSAVKVRGRMECSVPGPEERGSATYREQGDSSPVRMTPAAPALNCDRDRV